MKESIHKYFQVGPIQWMTHPKRDVLASIRTIVKDDYFDAIEVKMFADDDTREAARRILEQSHMKVCYGAHLPARNAIPPAPRYSASSTASNKAFSAFRRSASSMAFGFSPDPKSLGWAP